MTARLLIAVVLTLGAVMGVRLWNAHVLAQGDAQGAQRVQTAWNTAEAKRQANEALARMEAAQQLAERERQEREQEQLLQQQTDRIAHEQAQREQALRTAVAAADSRHRSLLSTIAQLNANAAAASADLPGTGPVASSCASADATRSARELLGQCSGRYAAVAAAADQLTSQVTGLQDYVRAVAPATAGGADGL